MQLNIHSLIIAIINQQMKLYLLYESAAGYGLFEREEIEEIAVELPKLQAALNSMEHFSKLVKLKAFQPFLTSEKALENMKAIADSQATDDLIQFLDTNLPKSAKSKKGKAIQVRLGVTDTKLGAEQEYFQPPIYRIAEKLTVTPIYNELVEEIARGIRLHFTKFLKKFQPTEMIKAQLGLAHSYSRSQIQFDPNRQDKPIIQAIAVLDQLDKDINTFSMRIKEWFAWHFPELKQIVTDNTIFAQVVHIIGSREQLTEDMREELTETTKDEEMVQAIYDSAKSSMGQDITESDKEMLNQLSSRLINMIKYREEMQNYLKERLNTVTPNMAALIGENVGARLISHAGGLVNLAKLPASTIQILGAEKALFRALKTRGNTPKYGLIYHSTYIGRAAAQNKGRISRSLANKLAMAARIDAFSLKSTTRFGETFRDQVEDRMKFFNQGPKPKKNTEVMAEVLEELKNEGLYVDNPEEENEPAEEEPMEIVEEPKKVTKKAAAKPVKKVAAKKKVPEPEPEEEEIMEEAEDEQITCYYWSDYSLIKQAVCTDHSMRYIV
eukprot:TRINITY_DN329_c0_g2_i2.p1 TRINITY_DN329_c0_g2~~TRINITY_DN329_c0_g2_i2.p1  ORF type:complete len:554 (-),score=78.76 TRINITY_DN329_c0_g2_i2:8103-9764(-)